MKWYGVIGYEAGVEETAPSVYTQQMREAACFGDVLEWGRGVSGADEVNDDMTLRNRLSILAVPQAVPELSAIRYASFGGALWKVTDIKVEAPRLILTLGGAWHGQTAKRTG